jgi:hypothetical protein
MRVARREAVRLLGVVVSVAVGLVACDSGDPFEALPVPDRVPAPTTSSVVPPDFSGVALAPVDGSTTTTEVVVGPGRAALAGRVNGPDGPVEGAVVRLERLVGDASARLDVVTGPDGLWQAPDILGGRYRVRAWREPDLAMLEPQILFLAAGQTLDSTLVVERFQALVLDSAVAPDPPFVGERTNLVVRVSSQVVDEDGVVRATPEAGVAVTLGTGLGWIAESPIRAQTSTEGSVTFTLVCRAPGPQPLMVTLPPRNLAPAPAPSPPTAQPPGPAASSTTVLAADPTPEIFNLDVPDCVEPPPPTTAPPPTTVPLPTTVAPTTTRPS